MMINDRPMGADDLLKMVITPKAGSPADPSSHMWKQKVGGHIRISKMETTHIFFALRMLFNHLAPSDLRIPGCTEYKGIQKWTAQYVARSVRGFVHELSKREDLPANLKRQYDYIAGVCANQLASRLQY